MMMMIWPSKPYASNDYNNCIRSFNARKPCAHLEREPMPKSRTRKKSWISQHKPSYVLSISIRVTLEDVQQWTDVSRFAMSGFRSTAVIDIPITDSGAEAL